MATFEPGATILVQEIWGGRVWSARPMRVVEDDGERAALWFPRGTRWMAPTTPSHRPRAETRGERLMTSLEFGDWVHREFEWDVSSIWFVEPRLSHAVWVSWREDGNHLGWYINLQEPFVRTDRGFQYMDLMLDIIVNPDRTWYWKDEDEFALMVERGLISQERARCVQREGESAVARMQANEPPFCDPWRDWQPNSVWDVPALPDAWDVA